MEGAADPDADLSLQRIVVIGNAGAGKTTFADRLAARIGSPRIELDALHWEPGWRAVDPQVFRARTDEATSASRWVADGGYLAVRDLVWGRATSLVWLDYPLPLVLARLFRRSTRRIVGRDEPWESWRTPIRVARFALPVGPDESPTEASGIPGPSGQLSASPLAPLRAPE